MSNPFLEPTTTFMYTLAPKRLAIMSEGPTQTEASIVARHWTHLQQLAADGTLIFAGRTLVTNEDSFASVVFRADSEAQARAIMDAGPAVSEGLIRAHLFPYQVLLVASQPRTPS